MLRLRPYLIATACAGVLVFAGCNVLDPAYTEGGDTQALLEDAAYARANGDFDRATELLEEAYAQEPMHPIVRIDLAATLLQRQGLNSISLVGRIAEHVEQQSIEGAPAEQGQREGLCSWDDDSEVRTFDPLALAELPEVLAEQPTLNRVRDLFATTEGAIMPEAFRSLNMCNVVNDGAIAYDRDALLDDLYASFGGDYNRVRTALMLNAVTLTLDSYVELFAEAERFPVNWYLVGESDQARLGYCTDPAEAPSFNDQVAAEASRVGRAMVSVDLLVHDSDHAGLSALRDEALEFYSRFENTLDDYCD